MHLLASLLFALFRHCLSLRYSVKLENPEVLQEPGPMLILPSHQALVDPTILFSELYRYTTAAPIMTEIYYNMALIRPFCKMVGAIIVPDVESRMSDDIDMSEIYGNAISALEQGRNIVLYPAGQLAGQGREALFGKRSAYEITKHIPDTARIVTVRVRGLWGSMWSKAWIGRSPPIIKTFLKAFFYIAANLILFCPRRRVTLSFADVTAEAKRLARDEDLLAYNQYLEDWYNQLGDEPVLFLRHFFYTPPLKRELPTHIDRSIDEYRRTQAVDADQVQPSVLGFVQAKVAALKDSDADSIGLEDNLMIDLHFDSLNIAEISAIIQQKYPKASRPPLAAIKTIGDLCLMAQGEKDETDELPVCLFTDQNSDSVPEIDQHKTILDHFLNVFTTDRNQAFGYDAYLGALNRDTFLTHATVLSLVLRRLFRGERVGIMLPAVQTSTMLVAATYLAQKVPVMFNWTVGETALRHCMDVTDTKRVITTKNFFETVKDQIPQSLHSSFIFLEDEVAALSVLTKARGWLAVWGLRSFFRRRRIPHHAVILFTSGSEALPKPVPLTHRNIIHDLWGVMERFQLYHEQRLISFLPPFHSFGFTVATIFPLISGLEVVYTPNPTDTRSILRIIRHTKPTVLPATPTFLRLLYSAAGQSDLECINLIVSGAEACPDSIRQLCREQSPHAILTEGYGITECSPVVTINPTHLVKDGTVGLPIGGLELFIADVETLKPVEPGQEGMIYVRGESIFEGYLDTTIDSPFTTIDGKQYYRTGDLGKLDEGGYLIITGRLKRFIKIAGEMISLPFIESILVEAFAEDSDEGPTVAVEGTDETESPQIVLFTTKDITVQQANEALAHGGAANIMHVHDVRTVEQIPVLGTGKTDYKVLKATLTGDA